MSPVVKRRLEREERERLEREREENTLPKPPRRPSEFGAYRISMKD